VHELGLTQQLVDMACSRAQEAGSSRVLAVDLSVGALSGVDAEAIAFCFDVVARGTLAEGAELRIANVAIEIECGDCGQRCQVADLALWCEQCESTNVRVVAGRRFRLRSLEVE
jgi:hydrogenase nickel incorporation protein HypA/HybF